LKPARPQAIQPLAAGESLRAQIARALRAALISGRLAPGVVHSVPALAREFGVSATPTREAMLDLVHEGLVEPVRNKGFRVVEMSQRDLDEIIELRLLIEPAAVAKAVGRISAAELAELRDLGDQVRKHAADGDLLGYVEIDRQLHLRLLAASGNQRLVGIVERLRAQTRLFGLKSLADQGVLIHSADEHTAILDAVERGDHEAAARLTAEHVAHARGRWATP